MTFEDPRRYLRIAGQIRRQIQEGTLKPGDQVARRKLVAETGYSRHTAGKGLMVLEREGMLTRIPGRGYIVTDDHRRQEPMQRQR